MQRFPNNLLLGIMLILISIVLFVQILIKDRMGSKDKKISVFGYLKKAATMIYLLCGLIEIGRGI